MQHVRFVKGRGTYGSGERNVKIWIDFRKSPRFSLTSPLSHVTLFLLCVVSPVDTDVVLFLNIELKIRKDHLFVMKIYDYFVYTVYNM